MCDTPKKCSCVDKRHSVRHFKSDQIPRETLEKIVRAGCRSPSAMNQQAYRFIVCQDQEFLKDVVETANKAAIAVGQTGFIEGQKQRVGTDEPFFYHAPTVIFVITPTEGAQIQQTVALDAGMAIENILVKATDLDVGSVPIGSVGMFCLPYLVEKLKLEKETVTLMIALGFIEDEKKEPKAEKKGIEKLVTWM